MDELDGAMQEIIDGAVSGDVQDRIEKINPVLAKHGLALISMKTEPMKTLPHLTLRPPSVSKEVMEASVTKLLVVIDLAMAAHLKAWQEFKPWLRKEKTVEMATSVIVDALSESIGSLQNGSDMNLSLIKGRIAEAKHTLSKEISVGEMGKITQPIKKAIGFNFARSFLAVADAEAFAVKQFCKSKNVNDIASLLSELYPLAVYLQKYMTAKL